MSDVFFSYCSEDRAKVKLVHDALTELGFDVFWDQEVPPGADWDSWIKTELKRTRSAVVFWTTASISSSNVRQEATIARDDSKLIQILLTPLRPDQFPMGLYTTQAIDLSDWDGSTDHDGWLKFRRELEIKVSAKWVARRLLTLETAIKAEQIKREMAEARESALEAKFADEVAARKAMRLERDDARAVAESASQTIEGLQETSRRTEECLAEAIAGRQALEEALKARAQPFPRWARWTAPITLVCLLLAGTWLGQSVIGQSRERDLTKIAQARIADLERQNAGLGKDLSIAQGVAARFEELEKENQKLHRDLRAARDLVEINYIDAAIAIRTARDKQAAEKGNRAEKIKASGQPE